MDIKVSKKQWEVHIVNKTIIALDFSSKQEVVNFLDNFCEPIFVKVGMELCYACGFDIIDTILERKHNIFLDLKLHDIPNTVKKSMENIAKLGVDMVNVHCAGGSHMMKAAIEGLEMGAKNDKRPLCIGVTQLTSTSQEQMQDELLIKTDLLDVVVSYARLAKESGLDGVVCAVDEVKMIHKACGEDFICVTPGIRLQSQSLDDQKRVATPEIAAQNGCDYIVVGRAITKSDQPNEVYQLIEESMR